MQIFEIMQRGTVNEISWSSIKQGADNFGRALGKSLVQAPVKALGNKVGADLLNTEKTKSPAEMMRDMQLYFELAVRLANDNKSEEFIKFQLMNKLGATEKQAEQAIDSMVDFIDNKSKRDAQNAQQQAILPTAPADQSGSQAFGTMTHQLGRAGNNTSATAPIQPAPTQQNIASTPATTTSTPAATQTTPNYGASTGPGVQPQSSVFPSSYTGTSTISAQSKPAPATPNYGTGTGPGVQPQTSVFPSSYTGTSAVPVQPKSATASATTPASTATANQQPISIGGQKIKPNDPLYAKIQKQLAQQQKPAAVAESLTWSHRFDPSATLLKKIRQL